MTEPVEFDSDPQLDRQLVAWAQSLRDDEGRLDAIKAAVLNEFDLDRSPRPVAHKENRSRGRRGFLIAAVLCLGVTGWLLRVTRDSHREYGTEIPFTSDEVRRREDLVCELERLFERRLDGVRQRGEMVSLNIVSESLDVQAPRLVLRFVLQRRVADEWTTVDQEEVMGPVDNQFHFAAPSQLEMDCWSHLLPDRSLWMESVVAPFGADSVRIAAQFQLNRPQELWSGSDGQHPQRVLVVYQLLSPCTNGVI